MTPKNKKNQIDKKFKNYEFISEAHMKSGREGIFFNEHSQLMHLTEAGERPISLSESISIFRRIEDDDSGSASYHPAYSRWLELLDSALQRLSFLTPGSLN